jgi:TRAP-type C4-dicarboxylate transport system permease small subunit
MNSQAIALLSRLLAAARCMSRAAVWLAGALTLASVLLIAYDVVVRRLFGITIGGSDELSSYAFAVSTTWALAFTVLERANVRVDIVYQYLPVRVSAVLDLVSLIALGVFAVYLTYYAYDVAMTSWMQNSAANTPLATPLWIPQTLWVLGLGWFAIVLALMLIRASTALVTGDIETLKALCGIRSAQEEADEEAATGTRLINGGKQA